jgi:hypothetical protein
VFSGGVRDIEIEQHRVQLSLRPIPQPVLSGLYLRDPGLQVVDHIEQVFTEAMQQVNKPSSAEPLAKRLLP